MVFRTLHYVGLLFLFSLASTFPWWAAAQVVRAEYRSLTSALACSMRLFLYSVCLLCILVALRAFNLEPQDPRSTLFGWLHLAGTAGIAVPCVWRAFRLKGPRMVVAVAVGWMLCAAIGGLAYLASADFRAVVWELPRFISKA